MNSLNKIFQHPPGVGILDSTIMDTSSFKKTIKLHSDCKVCTSEGCNNPPKYDLMNVYIQSNRNGSCCELCKEDLEKQYNAMPHQILPKDPTLLELTIKGKDHIGLKYSFYGTGIDRGHLDKINTYFIGFGYTHDRQ